MSSGVDAFDRGTARLAMVTYTGVYHSRSRWAKTCYPSRAVRAGFFLLSVTLTVTVVGCGRRATRADCQLLVDRSVELQMKGASETDPAAIARRKAEVRAELDDKISACERDRRVTERTMACVQSASNSQDLDKCLQ